MYEIDSKLMELEDKQTPIHVSLIGCGQMGKDIIAQISKMKGIVCDIAVDIDTDFVLDDLRGGEKALGGLWRTVYKKVHGKDGELPRRYNFESL